MRYSWKVDMIDDRRARMATEPVELPEGLEGSVRKESKCTIKNTYGIYTEIA